MNLMSVKTLDTFTFIFFVANTRNKLEKRQVMLNAVRGFINTIDSFREAKVTIKPRRIAIEHNDYFFAFDSQGVFNMGFSTSENKIDFLSNTMNEVCAKLTEKIGQGEKMEIDIFSTGEYIINKKYNLFAKLIQDQNLHKICYQNGAIKPTRINLKCSGMNSNNSVRVSLYKGRKENKLHITLERANDTGFIPDAAKDAAHVINEMANRISKELISET